VVHRCALETKRFICNCIESSSGWYLALVLKYDLQVLVLADTRLTELEHGCAVGLELVGLGHLQGGQRSLASDLEAHFALLGVQLSVLDDGLEHAAVLLHLCWTEVHCDVLVLVGYDAQRLRLYFECEALALGQGAGLDAKLDVACNFVWIHNLESFACALGVLACNQRAEPEHIFLYAEQTRADYSLSVQRGVE